MSKYQWIKLEDPQEWANNGGIGIIAEEYDGTRICLESCERYDAISCGGGWLHVMFVGKDHSRQVYKEMKKDLEYFTDNCDDWTREKREEYLTEFREKYWE